MFFKLLKKQQQILLSQLWLVMQSGVTVGLA